MIDLDGAHGEGGGQILRTALGLAAITGQAFTIRNVRANRPEPGLKAQHAAVAAAFAHLTGGRVEGGHVGSQALTFTPATPPGGELTADIGTAGSIPLFLQALLPALASGSVFWRITVSGGSDGAWAPTWDYFARVHVNTLERLGWRPRAKLVRRGWYPRGGGAAILEAGPWQPKPFALRRTGRPFQVAGRIALSNLPDHVAARVRSSALERFAAEGYDKSEIDIVGYPAKDPGVSVAVWADDGTCILGADALGAPGRPGESLGREVADALLAEIAGGGSVDAAASDQLMIYAALAAARGPCSYEARTITSHARTNAAILERFLPVRFTLAEGTPARISVSAT